MLRNAGDQPRNRSRGETLSLWVGPPGCRAGRRARRALDARGRGERGAMESGALLRELVRIPWRHRVLVVIVTALVTGASLVWAYKQPVEYSASSRILLTSLSAKARKALGVSPASAGTLDSLSPATQAKLIGSPQIAEVVSKAINGLISKDQLAASVNATVVAGSQN